MANNQYRNRELEQYGRGRNRGERGFGSEDRERSMGGYEPSSPNRGEDYFGSGRMQYGGGYQSGDTGRGYEGYNRDYQDEMSDYNQPSRNYTGGYGADRDSEREGYRGFGSESSRRHSGVGYSGRSGYRGEYGRSRFGGHGTEDFNDYGWGSGGSGRDRSDQSDDRGWFEKAGDEVSSWFGDEEAARRRKMDSRREGQHRGRGPSGYTRSDDRIKEDVNDRLTDNSFIDASNVNVEASNGDITLTGTVESRYEKRLAEDIAEDVSGVKNVENRIRVNREAYSQGSMSYSETTGTTSTTDTSETTGRSRGKSA